MLSLDTPDKIKAHAVCIGKVAEIKKAINLWRRVDQVAMEKKIGTPVVISLAEQKKKFFICEIPYRKVGDKNWEDFEDAHIMGSIYVANAVDYLVQNTMQLGFTPSKFHFTENDDTADAVLELAIVNPNFDPFLHLKMHAGLL